eukprot:TRINITY_DN1196_c1_g1_i1.p1 TRINITY_DN1196_c1_g1~~TRINITY_DN1196_c1_g1_i1.p1  ORF type:complete len:629 (+),score=150.02 TRINITY_DN1196_c1_g1_i1:50-1936(+)
MTRFQLHPIGEGGHRAINVNDEGTIVGRGETTGLYNTQISRQHCQFRIREGELEVKSLGTNSIIILPMGSSEMSYKLGAGKSDVVTIKDRIALLPDGQFLYVITATDLPPPIDDPEDRFDPNRFLFRRTSSACTKLPSDVDKAKEDLEADDGSQQVLDSGKRTAPATKAVKKLKPIPVCKYGENCTRKNPAHFLEYSHGATDSSALPVCKYGANCTRKNPMHFKQFSHGDKVPSQTAAAAAVVVGGDDDDDEDDEAKKAKDEVINQVDVTDINLRKKRCINGVVPDRHMPEDELVMVSGGGQEYKMKYTADGYYCTCVAWRYQNKAVNERTCKHLKEYLGEDYERERCNLGPGTVPKAAKGAAKKFVMPGVLLAEKWDEKKPITGYWMSEKLDGVRAFWNGSTFLSRNGNEFTAPDWFTKCLPKDQHLDGELFCGRGKFQTTVSVVKSSAEHPGWKTTTYEVFDIPSVKECWEKRMDAMNSLPCASTSHINICKQERCKGTDHVTKELNRIIDLKGEGVMLRQPGSMYVHSRSSTLLKVKRFMDCEAIVRAIETGKGRNSGRMGALQCELENGKRFNVGTGFTDAQRNNPPPVGSIITVKYQELTVGGIPRFPAYLGVRIDAVWKGKK